MKNAIIVTHRSDVDGIVSAALLQRFCRHKFNAELILCVYRNQEKIFRQIAEKAADKVVYVADICAKDFLLDSGKETVLQHLAARAKKIIWFDHHPATRNFMPLFEKHGHKIIVGDECAAKLIQKRLELGDWYAKFLANVVQAHDYPSADSENFYSKTAEGLQKIISYYNSKNNTGGLINLVDLLAKDSLWYLIGEFAPKLKRIINKADVQIELARENVSKNSFLLRTKGKSFIIACTEAILYDKKTVADLRDEFAGEKVDGVAVYFLPPVKHLLFYRLPGSDFNAQEFCKFMGGDGREGNGGFSPPIKYDREKFKLLVAFLLRKLNEFI